MPAHRHHHSEGPALRRNALESKASGTQHAHGGRGSPESQGPDGENATVSNAGVGNTPTIGDMGVVNSTGAVKVKGRAPRARSRAINKSRPATDPRVHGCRPPSVVVGTPLCRLSPPCFEGGYCLPTMCNGSGRHGVACESHVPSPRVDACCPLMPRPAVASGLRPPCPERRQEGRRWRPARQVREASRRPRHQSWRGSPC